MAGKQALERQAEHLPMLLCVCLAFLGCSWACMSGMLPCYAQKIVLQASRWQSQSRVQVLLASIRGAGAGMRAMQPAKEGTTSSSSHMQAMVQPWCSAFQAASASLQLTARHKEPKSAYLCA